MPEQRGSYRINIRSLLFVLVSSRAAVFQTIWRVFGASAEKQNRCELQQPSWGDEENTRIACFSPSFWKMFYFYKCSVGCFFLLENISGVERTHSVVVLLEAGWCHVGQLHHVSEVFRARHRKLQLKHKQNISVLMTDYEFSHSLWFHSSLPHW